MKNITAYQMILNYQKVWASSRHIRFQESGQREGYVYALADNLFYDRLSVKTVGEYLSGLGSELSSHMKALYSSSALCINVFEYWRQTRRTLEIAKACGALIDVHDMEFEKKHKISDLGTPHIDVEFSNGDKEVFAIEVKFTEPYRTNTRRNNTNLDKYLKQDSIWVGLGECQKLAKEVLEEEHKKTSWKYLDVPQLIKHILGLSYYYKAHDFTLLCLWFDCETEEAEEHRKEIDAFGERITKEIYFTSMTYQDLFGKISAIPRVDKKYLSYLADRYMYIDNANILFLF